jgi:GNAT superfamily N-acetyltransferase
MCCMEKIEIRSLANSDIQTIVECFTKANWPKPAATFETYLKEQNAGERLAWVAFEHGHPEFISGSEMLKQVQHDNEQFAGYVTLKWQSNYQPFRENQIPEIMDLNVLPPFQGKGIGSKLLKTAENAAFNQNDVVGLGVGLYAGYGKAQKLYISKGYIPDGNGVTYNYQPVEPGNSTTLDDDLVLWFSKKLR